MWRTNLGAKSRWSQEEGLLSKTSSATRTPGVQRGVDATIALCAGANQEDARERELYTLQYVRSVGQEEYRHAILENR